MEQKPDENEAHTDEHEVIPEANSDEKLTADEMKKRLKRQSKSELIKFILHLLRSLRVLEKAQASNLEDK